MYLITRNSSKDDNDVTQDVINQFENSISSKEKVQLHFLISKPNYLSLALKWLILKTKLNFSKFARKKFDVTFCIHMGPEYGKSARYFLQSETKIAYFFDVWPYTFDNTKSYLERLKIDIAFISSLQATEYFKSVGLKNIFWVPEGINPAIYKYYSYDKKDIDVLELGRKHLAFHEKIAPILKSHDKIHLFEFDTGQIIFADNNLLIDGLARTKISICFPRSITHSVSAGNISTLTNRYLQSMAAKCLLVGESPYEMKFLFDYDPVVKIDLDNADNEIIAILNNFDKYIPLIEKNYENVMKFHKWSNRWENITDLIKKYNGEIN